MVKKAEPKFKIKDYEVNNGAEIVHRLDKVTFPKSFDGILVIPQGIKHFARYACKGKNEIKEVVLPEGINSIGIEVFADCENLEKINLPASLRYLGDSCFANCTSLKELYIPATLEYIRTIDLLGLPASTKVIIDEAHPSEMIENGAILSKDGQEFERLLDDVEEYEVKEGVKKIGPYAFKDHNQLKKVTLPASIEVIDTAFVGCPNLTTIVIKSKADINLSSTFDGCCSPSSPKASIFEGTTVLKAICVPANKIDYYKENIRNEHLHSIIMELPD